MVLHYAITDNRNEEVHAIIDAAIAKFREGAIDADEVCRRLSDLPDGLTMLQACTGTAKANFLEKIVGLPADILNSRQRTGLIQAALGAGFLLDADLASYEMSFVREFTGLVLSAPSNVFDEGDRMRLLRCASPVDSASAEPVLHQLAGMPADDDLPSEIFGYLSDVLRSGLSMASKIEFCAAAHSGNTAAQAALPRNPNVAAAMACAILSTQDDPVAATLLLRSLGVNLSDVMSALESQPYQSNVRLAELIRRCLLRMNWTAQEYLQSPHAGAEAMTWLLLAQDDDRVAQYASAILTAPTQGLSSARKFQLLNAGEALFDEFAKTDNWAVVELFGSIAEASANALDLDHRTALLLGSTSTDALEDAPLWHRLSAETAYNMSEFELTAVQSNVLRALARIQKSRLPSAYVAAICGFQHGNDSSLTAAQAAMARKNPGVAAVHVLAVLRCGRPPSEIALLLESLGVNIPQVLDALGSTNKAQTTTWAGDIVKQVGRDSGSAFPVNEMPGMSHEDITDLLARYPAIAATMN
ncbi:MAG: hypothetical protein H7255_15610 [Ramlibacter sp.]|nr:hypothetical protein [Ramlibacter sp.]